MDTTTISATPGTTDEARDSGPLTGMRIIEIAGRGPIPFAGMMLADKGESLFRTRTRQEWCELLGDADACFSLVLGLGDVAEYPHHLARDSFPTIDGVPQPAPAPRFSRTRPVVRSLPPAPGEHTRQALQDWGFDSGEVQQQLRAGAIR